jgi:hypothetical protein
MSTEPTPGTGTGTLSVDKFVDDGLSGAGNMETELDQIMNKLMEGDTEISNQDLVAIQYKMSKYQTYMTTLNNTVQSIQNQTKEMAKSIH